MLLLGIDTATEATSVAVHDGTQPLAELTTVDARRHAEVLGPAIRDALRKAGAKVRDVTAIGVGVGPGPYTGLRVGVATAEAIGDALAIPVHGVCTLDVLAHQAGEACTVVTDARRREVFWATYDEGQRVHGPVVTRPTDVVVTGRVVGPGAERYADMFGIVSAPTQISAAALCALVASNRAELVPARPIYLRRPDTAPPRPAKPVLQS